MPELSRDAIGAKLDAIPEADREPYVQALKAQGYTWKSDQQAITNDAPAEIKPPPSNPNFEIAGRSQTAAAPAPAFIPRSDVQNSEFADPLKTFLTNDPVDPFNTMLRGLPAAIGGSIAGAAVAPATGFVGTGAAYGAGAAAIESARQGLAQAYAGITGREFTPNDEVLKNIGAQAAMNAAGGALTKAPQAFGKAYDYAAKNFGGMAADTVAAMKENAAEVAKRVGISKEEIGLMSAKMRDAIYGAVEAGQQKYAQVAEKITGAVSSPINLKAGISETIEKIGNDFGYNAKDLAPIANLSRLYPELDAPGIHGVTRISDAGEVALFNQFKETARSLSNATPQQVYYFQRDLAKAIRSNVDKPIAAALGQVKGAVNQWLPQAAKVAPELGPLAEANSAYAAAMSLEKEARGITNADDAIRFIRNAYSPNKYSSQTRETLDALRSQVPEFDRLVQDARYSMAAQEAGQLLRPLPQTGFGAAMAAGAGAAATKLPVALATAPAFSPRAYLAGYQGAQYVAGSQFGKSAAAALEAMSPAVPVGTTALANYYQAGGR